MTRHLLQKSPLLRPTVTLRQRRLRRLRARKQLARRVALLSSLVCLAHTPSVTFWLIIIGNLPYTATKEQIEEHFAKIKPTEIRLRTYKGTNKFMGTCFVEFDRFDRMETALKKYHHSVFPDGKKKEGRKINVELR